jgi:hypothetical protein
MADPSQRIGAVGGHGDAAEPDYTDGPPVLVEVSPDHFVAEAADAGQPGGTSSWSE